MSDSAEVLKVPLFPLNAVLFPGGNLSLRIFEPRYLSMVSECMKSAQPFGVVLIKQGQEAGKAATFHNIGTLAEIVDFDRCEDGLLGLRCKGTTRFQTKDFQVQQDRLIVGDIGLLNCEGASLDSQDMMTKYNHVTDFIKTTLSRPDFKYYRSTISEHWNDPDWITFQAAELVSLDLGVRQHFLELGVEQRLNELSRILSSINVA